MNNITVCTIGHLNRPVEALKGSSNSGWRNTSFRGYADNMRTAECNQKVEQGQGCCSTR